MTGVLYARSSGAWVPIHAPGIGVPAGGLTDEALVKRSNSDYDTMWKPITGGGGGITSWSIPDPVGSGLPTLTFEGGDGANGVGPNPYLYQLYLYNDRLTLISGRQSKRVVEFSRTGADRVTFAVQDWECDADSTGYLRWYYGADRSNVEFSVNSAGDGYFRGSLGVIGTGINAFAARVSAADFVAGNGAYYGNGNITLNPNGSGYSNCVGYNGNVSLLSGHAAYYANWAKVSINCQPPGNNAEHRPLSLHKNAGGGEVGLGFLNHVTGWTGSWQLHYDGSIYLGAVNGGNSATIKVNAAAFNVVSTRRFKADIERVGALGRYIVDHVEPVRFRDLQHEMEMAPECLAVMTDGTPREPPTVEPLWRFGLVAEEVAAVAPELVAPSMHGPGLDVSGLVAVLWQAVKTLSARVEALEAPAS